jgi:hypothetical protein
MHPLAKGYNTELKGTRTYRPVFILFRPYRVPAVYLSPCGRGIALSFLLRSRSRHGDDNKDSNCRTIKTMTKITLLRHFAMAKGILTFVMSLSHRPVNFWTLQWTNQRDRSLENIVSQRKNFFDSQFACYKPLDFPFLLFKKSTEMINIKEERKKYPIRGRCWGTGGFDIIHNGQRPISPFHVCLFLQLSFREWYAILLLTYHERDCRSIVKFFLVKTEGIGHGLQSSGLRVQV